MARSWSTVFTYGSLTVIVLASCFVDIQADSLQSNTTMMPLINETKETPVNVSNGIYNCPAVDDGMLYWESVPPGTYGKPCSKSLAIFADFPDSVQATRTCLENGEWWDTNENGTGNGFTNFNVCLEFFEERKAEILKHYRILNTLQTIGMSLSLTALILGIIIFVYFKKLRVARNYIHINLFISFILRHVSVLITEEIVFASAATDATVLCKTLSVISHFAILANYHWLLMEGIYLYSLLSVAVLSERSRLGCYIGIGWGGPLIVTVAWVLAHRNIDMTSTEYGLAHMCWTSITEFKTYWILDVPMIFTIVLNTILFLLILCVIRDKLKTSTTSETKKVIKLARSTMVLIPLFGLYYVVFLVIREDMVSHSMEMVKIYFDLLIGSVQGLLVAVLYCFMNGEVRQEIGRKWRLHKLNRALSSHRSLRDVNSRVSYSNHGGTKNESMSEAVRNNSNGTLSLRSKLLNFRISALTSTRDHSPGKVACEVNGNVRGSKVTANVDEMTENETRIVNFSDDYEYNSEDGQILTGLCERTNVEKATINADENEADETSKLQPDHESTGETVV